MSKNNYKYRQLLSFSASLTLAMGVTSVTWAGATTDGSAGPVASYGADVGTPDFTIPDSIGTTVDNNLFHSFNDFSINAGESATFTGPDVINNVITRVTGNDPSTFNGTLQSQIPTANFYFMNPNGVIFKENAALIVDGSFYASTSNYIKMGQSDFFYADKSTSGMISAPPSAFGFLDSNPGQISMEGTLLFKNVNLFQPDGATFSLIAGDITLKTSPTFAPNLFGAPYTFISLTGNSFEMISVASAGEAVLGNSGYDLSSFDTLGNVTLAANTVVDATDVYIRGGTIVIDDAIIAPGLFYALGATTDATQPGTIDIAARSLVSITGTAPFPYLRPDGGAYVAGITAFGGNPNDGELPVAGSDINISGGNVLVSGTAAVANIRYGPGKAGDINITGDTVEIRNGGLVTNINAFDGAGGNITVTADEVILDNEDHTGSQTGLNATSNFSVVYLATDGSVADPTLLKYTTADAGTITVNATGPGGLTVKNGASINTESRAYGRAGDINIEASTINLSRDGKSTGAISSQSLFAGDAGNIDIHAADDINITSGFEISGNSIGTGVGGNVSVTADGSINISGEDSGIASASSAPTQEVKDLLGAIYNPILGAAGPTYSDLTDILNLYLGTSFTNDSSIYDVMSAMHVLGVLTHPDFAPGANPNAGDGGSVLVTASALNMDVLSKISSATSTDGNGGTINIQVDTLTLSGGAETRSRSGLPDIISGELKVGTGDGGSISIVASESVNMQSGSSISASSLGDGTAGNISLDTDTLGLIASSITSEAEGAGAGGNINVVDSNSVTMDSGSNISASSLGDGTAGNISLDTDTLGLIASSITSEAEGAGAGGDINIVDSNSVTMDSGSNISASSLGDGTAGNISLDTGTLGLIASSITSEAEGAGAGGNINVVDSNSVTMDSGSNISASSLGDGTAGNISLDTDTLGLIASSITSEAEGAGAGGDINIGDINIVDSNSVTMDSGSIISASSQGEGFAGDISINAGNVLEMNNSSISTKATVSDGGDIEIKAIEMVYLDQSEITTSVGTGSGNGGNIDIDPEFVILKQSSILAQAHGGDGGSITIVTDNYITSEDSIVSASSALGVDGTVEISSPENTVSDDLAVLPDSYLDVTSLIGERCGTNTGSSSLVDAGPGGRAVDPDGYLPSFAANINYNNEENNGEKSASNGNRWWATYAQQPTLQVAQMTCTF